MIEMKLRPDASELIPYNQPDFPAYARVDRMADYPDRTCLSHWHEDIEFVLPLEGPMCAVANGRETLLRPGQGQMVNSGRLHGSHALNGADCRYLCVTLHPSLLCATEDIRAAYVEPLCGPRAPAALPLSEAEPADAAILAGLKAIAAQMEAAQPGYELAVTAEFQRIWLALMPRLRGAEADSLPDSELNSLHAMVGLIQQRYGGPLSLNEIAAAGGLCRSACCRLFRRALHTTPNAYLNDVRLERSMEWLARTQHTITEIALACGFNSSSYFAEFFCKRMGKKPGEWRREARTPSIENPRRRR